MSLLSTTTYFFLILSFNFLLVYKTASLADILSGNNFKSVAPKV